MVTIGLSMGVPSVARLVIELVPASVWDVAEPHSRTTAAGFLVWTSSQAAHKLELASP